jgi:hypothetical protein|tara:strand:- start:138 stop:1151 length:1014 start_codon:yes stop_codon:yes gene_type:complete
MPMQQVEYEFPDPDKKDGKDVEVEVAEEAEFEIEIEGAVGREEIGKPKEIEVEVVDDTPKADRGRKSSSPPEEVTEEELENYSEKVKKRIKHFSKGYHDERRAKETAERERTELERYTRQLVDENKELKGSVNKSHNTLIDSAKQQVETELGSAKRQYKQAYEGGQSEEMVTAQEALNAAQIRADKVNNLQRREETPLQTPDNAKESPKASPTIQRDPQAIAWADNNSWFGADDEMTAFALGLHTKLTKGGTDPQSKEYYEKIDSRMREVFPTEFDEGIEDEPIGRKKSSNVVAPATRSRSPKKVTLSQTQVALAKRLGVTLEDYAKQAAVLMRKQD